MDFGKLTKQAKKFVDEHGGTEALGAEAKNLQGILKGKGSLSDKAKQAAASAKEFGKPASQSEPSAAPEPEPEPEPATGEPAAAKPAPVPPAPTAPPEFD